MRYVPKALWDFIITAYITDVNVFQYLHIKNDDLQKTAIDFLLSLDKLSFYYKLLWVLLLSESLSKIIIYEYSYFLTPCNLKF